MILRIARKEFVDTWRDGRFRLGALVTALLLLTAGLLAWRQTERMAQERAAASAIERENWLEQGEKNSHSAGHYGVNVFKPLAPLALFDRGIEPFVGTTLFLEAHRQNQASFVPAQDATAMRRFGELTAAAGLQWLAPLLIVLLAFGSIAGERERGTLRQTLSLGVRPLELVLGKTLGLALALAILFAPLVLAGVVGLAQSLPDEAFGVWTRASALALAYALYFALALVGGVAVSALAPNARSALIVLLALWAVSCVVAPRLASDVAHARVPLPALAEFEKSLGEDLQNGLDGHDSRSKQMEEFTAQTLKQYGKARVEDLPFNFYGLAMLESERIAASVFDHHFGALWDRIEEQDRFVTWGGALAPLLALRSASMALSGTDFTHHRHFAVAAEKHRRDFVRVLNEDLKDNAKPGDHGYVAGRALWEQLPQFELTPLPASAALKAATPGLTLLGAWLVAAFGVLVWAAGRLRGTLA